jgi:hypothetical protein
MTEAFKNRIIIISGILSLIFCIVAVTSCNRAMRQDTRHRQEMLKRMNAEEALSNVGREKETAQKKLDASVKELTSAKQELEQTKRTLLQEQLISQSLKEDVLKLTKLKEKLEDDLKEALVAVRSAQQPVKKQ